MSLWGKWHHKPGIKTNPIFQQSGILELNESSCLTQQTLCEIKGIVYVWQYLN